MQTMNKGLVSGANAHGYSDISGPQITDGQDEKEQRKQVLMRIIGQIKHNGGAQEILGLQNKELNYKSSKGSGADIDMDQVAKLSEQELEMRAKELLGDL